MSKILLRQSEARRDAGLFLLELDSLFHADRYVSSELCTALIIISTLFSAVQIRHKKGGAYQTVQYAEKHSVEVVNLTE